MTGTPEAHAEAMWSDLAAAKARACDLEDDLARLREKNAKLTESLQAIRATVKALRGSGRLNAAVRSNPQTTEQFLACSAWNIGEIADATLKLVGRR